MHRGGPLYQVSVRVWKKQLKFGIGVQKIVYFSGKQNLTRSRTEKSYSQKHFNNYYGSFPLFLMELIDSAVCIA